MTGERKAGPAGRRKAAKSRSRLTDAKSAYLRSAADQPVAWHPWGPEVFERARQENKPVLLDIGAVWCHWCHVMDRESYENPAIADQLNRDWICVKVDRDERPDVDARYQRAVQAITGQGGWPLTGFLTPDGEVFYGGTYFPPDGAHGRPGFGTVLAELARAWQEERDKITEQTAMIRTHLAQHTLEARAGPVPPDVLRRAADGMARVFDFRYGGFGTQPKFPHSTACLLLLHRWADTRESWPREMVDRSLAAMALGGVYDHVGGGFHRYSVDAHWIVPHFEKMLYDNSELLRVYVHAAVRPAADLRTGSPAVEDPGGLEGLYRRTVEGILRWTLDVMADPAGGYYASQDADVGLDDDGDYFTWTTEEVRDAVDPAEYEALVRRFDVEERGEMQHDPRRNVLFVKRSFREIAASLGIDAAEAAVLVTRGLGQLAAARAGREAPFVDRTIYTGWSAMMASAVLHAGAFLDRPALDAHALRTLERLFTDTADPAGGHRHAIGSDVTGLLEDQVHLASAAIDAYEASGFRLWLDRAGTLMDHVWQEYRTEGGALADRRPRDGEGLLTHVITPVVDAPTPSPTGVAAVVLARLAEHTRSQAWLSRRDALLAAFGAGLDDLGLHGASLLLGADWSLNPATHVVVIAGDDPTGHALRRAARAAFRPRKVLTLLPPDAPTNGLPAPVRAMLDGQAPRAYVCIGPECRAPVADAEALTALLAEP